MGRLEDLATSYANNARYDLGKALNRIASLDDEGTLGDDDLSLIAYSYHRMSWWLQVTDLTHGREETVDGGTALLTVRQRAQEFLIDARLVTSGGLFAQAMAESRRGGARAFLDATQKLADALALPVEPDAHPADDSSGRTAPPAGEMPLASAPGYRP
ncbi:hypothetical protein [Nonomuraea sp. bgisy101]|uniref:hypothetical protein n=1 Tax=Nonomuraea sp. bgisy101 TaxID=3413784 RepID=UPI003D70CFCF